jgi:DNA adenine methylase
MMHSPLRYPGGKSDFLLTVRRVFEDGGFAGVPVVEPYAGSAAVSLGLLDLGLTPHVTLLERDPLIYAFWHCVFNKTSDFIVAYQDLPIDLETWLRFQPLLRVDAPTSDQLLEMGLACLFLNRANFSGILNAGPIGGKGQRSKYKIDCRTNKDDIIGRILALAMHANQVDVRFGDAVDLMRERAREANLFFYLDPPYFNKGELLYRHFYSLRQHKELAALLGECQFDWLLSYDDHHVIEFLYEPFHVNRLAFRYSAHSPKNHDELLISNFELPITDPHLLRPMRRQRSAMPSTVLV